MSELSAAAGVNYDGPFDTLFSCAPSPAAAYTAAMALTELHKSERLGVAALRRYVSKASRTGEGPARRRPDA